MMMIMITYDYYYHHHHNHYHHHFYHLYVRYLKQTMSLGVCFSNGGTRRNLGTKYT